MDITQGVATMAAAVTLGGMEMLMVLMAMAQMVMGQMHLNLVLLERPT